MKVTLLRKTEDAEQLLVFSKRTRHMASLDDYEAVVNMTPEEIAKELDIPRARNIVYDNHYRWFEGLGKGIYQLSEFGAETITAFSEN